MAKKVKIKVGKESYIGLKEGDTLYTSIKDSTSILGFKYSQYTRRLLLEGKLDSPTPSIKVKEGSFSKWYIAIPSLVNYLSNRVERDSTRRFILRVDLGEEARVREALTKAKIPFSLELAYIKGKAKKSSSKKAPPKKEEVLEEIVFSLK